MPKLLVVDDEKDILEFAKKFFARRQIDVLIAADGDAALKVLHEDHPDLMLLDVRMEGMDGIELLRQIRSERNTIKVVMVTGVNEENTVVEANGLGICGYIHKPLLLDELERIVLAELKNC